MLRDARRVFERELSRPAQLQLAGGGRAHARRGAPPRVPRHRARHLRASPHARHARKAIPHRAHAVDQTTWGALVQLQPAGSPTIGPTRAIAGILADQDSFDAQLVEATNRPALGQALGTPGPTAFARNVAELPAAYDIVTPTGTIAAQFVDFVPQPRYEVGSHVVGHRPLVQSQTAQGTNPGSSGSPVVSRDGQTLFGMHIAGKAEIDAQSYFIAISYMIPAWDLFTPLYYANAGSTETWSLVSP